MCVCVGMALSTLYADSVLVRTRYSNLNSFIIIQKYLCTCVYPVPVLLAASPFCSAHTTCQWIFQFECYVELTLCVFIFQTKEQHEPKLRRICCPFIFLSLSLAEWALSFIRCSYVRCACMKIKRRTINVSEMQIVGCGEVHRQRAWNRNGWRWKRKKKDGKKLDVRGI